MTGRVGLPSRATAIASWYRHAAEPTVRGLPNFRVAIWFPLIIALGAILLIALNISGTSSGAYWFNFGVGQDPNAILGGPRPIRSDEWLVHQGWVVSQITQGFPATNQTFPGGMDVTVAMELPVLEWSSIFRPHVWGYLFLGLDGGLAWQWWIPAFALVSGAYQVLIVLLPSRPLTAAMVACAVYFSPLFQWWYGPSTLWPAAWAMLAMAGTVWILRTDRLAVRIGWSVMLGWLGVTVAISLYVPFILPAVLVFFFFFIGSILRESPWQKERGLRLLKRIAPLLLSGLVAGGVVIAWVVTRAGTINAISSTVYPGLRTAPTGDLLVQDPYLAGLGGAIWGQSFRTSSGPTLLGPNASESATVILLGVFLLPGLIWFSARRWRAERVVDWLMVSTVACIGLFLAYLLIPGWDGLSHLLLLDRVQVSRMRMGFAVLLPVVFALVARETDRIASRSGPGWIPALICLLVAVATNGFVLRNILNVNPELLTISLLWPAVLVAVLAAVALVFFRRTVATSSVALLMASMLIGAAVNPLYRGGFDLTETDVGQGVLEVDAEEQGTWVGVGSYLVMGLMMETGVRSFNGVQTYPPQEMWELIDPDKTYSDQWNRLAHVRWTPGAGEPAVMNPQQDVILSTFDACSNFAQQNVDYVLADEPIDSEQCLVELADISQGASRMQIYSVVEPR